MARCQIVYWQEIPSVVEVRQGRKSHKLQLSERFQALIDTVAMKKDLVGTDEYLEHWHKESIGERDGNPEQIATAIAEEIEGRFKEIRDAAMQELK